MRNEIRCCMNCRFEPEWQPVSKTKRGRYVRHGYCRWEDLKLLFIPICFSVKSRRMEYYLDSAGCGFHCPAWEGKR